MHIGSQIKERRTELEMTQEELAEKLNVSRSTVSNWEIERNYPDINLIVALSDILDISLDELLRGDSEVVRLISEDTRQRGKLKRKVRYMYISIAVICIALISVFWANNHMYDIGSDSYIESVEVDGDKVYVTTDLPFYRSLSAYYMDQDGDALNVTLSTHISLLEHNEKMTVSLENDFFGPATKLNFVDHNNNAYKSVEL